MEPHEGRSVPASRCRSHPGQLGARARPPRLGKGQLCPPRWARLRDTAPGLGLGTLLGLGWCRPGNKPSPSWSQQQEEFSCPHPEGNGGLGVSSPAQGSRGRWM